VKVGVNIAVNIASTTPPLETVEVAPADAPGVLPGDVPDAWSAGV
jgi:hypothetical protein